MIDSTPNDAPSASPEEESTPWSEDDWQAHYAKLAEGFVEVVQMIVRFTMENRERHDRDD